MATIITKGEKLATLHVTQLTYDQNELIDLHVEKINELIKYAADLTVPIPFKLIEFSDAAEPANIIAKMRSVLIEKLKESSWSIQIAPVSGAYYIIS